MNKIIPVETKVKVMEASMQLGDVEEIASRYGVSPGAVYYWFNRKVKPAFREILENDPPGPKGKSKPEEEQTAEETERRGVCDRCGNTHIWKNGPYQVLNWLWLLSVGWLVVVQKAVIQRWRCAECGRELVSKERQAQGQARVAWWQQVKRLIGLSRFKLNLSVRKTQVLGAFTSGREVSAGFIQSQTQAVGRQAKSVLERLSACRQKVANFLLYDETFPKLGKRAYSLGVAICENGLIRSVRVIRSKAKDIPAQWSKVVGEHFHPENFLTDLDVAYGEYLKRANLTMQHLRDIVHLMRQMARMFEDAVREVTLDVPKGLPQKERQKQRHLKQRLLEKRLKPILEIVFRAFAPGNEAVCLLMLEGVVTLLHDPSLIIQTESVRRLTNRMERFLKKHGPAINALMEMAVEHNAPKTTNSLESKNAIFKPFSLIAKSFRLATAENFFAGVALMENFDLKTRGLHQDTSAIQRAEINLDDLGATDFFSLVGLNLPQISPSAFTL